MDVDEGEVRWLPGMGRVLNMAVRDGTGAQYGVGIGCIQSSYLVYIYLLAIAICGTMGCYGHLLTMLCVFFYQTLGTDHKVRGWGSAKSVYIETLFC